MKADLIIGSRGSRLALWQATSVKNALETLHPQFNIEIVIIKTSGDVMKDESLSVIGGKGVFTKELEEALLDRRIDVAVHSLKDLPTTSQPDLAIAAICEREDPRDALVMRADSALETSTLQTLTTNATVGTSSPRRIAQLKHVRPDLEIKDLRGNVDTRLRKLDAGWYDAVVLASAGLRRLDLHYRISAYLEPGEILPAVGQGALGVQTRADDRTAIEMVEKLDHAPTRIACTAERALLRELGGGCLLPIAGHAVIKGDRLRLDGLVAHPNGARVLRDQLDGATNEPVGLGHALAQRLLSNGAADLLSATV